MISVLKAVNPRSSVIPLAFDSGCLSKLAVESSVLSALTSDVFPLHKKILKLNGRRNLDVWRECEVKSGERGGSCRSMEKMNTVDKRVPVNVT